MLVSVFFFFGPMLLKMGEDGEWVVWMQGKGEKVMGVGFEGDVGEGVRVANV